MGRERHEIYRHKDRDRKDRERKKSKWHWRDLPVATYLQAFLALSFFMAAAVAFLWITGIVDFTAARGYLKLTLLGPDLTRRAVSACGYVYLFIPTGWQSVPLCVTLNVLPFAFLPLVVLGLLARRLVAGIVGD